MSPEEFKRRTFSFGIRVVRLVQALPKKDVARDVGRQLLRAGTSVGANYRAAARARSRADFVAKLGIVEEECDESLYWLEMLMELELVTKKRVAALYNGRQRDSRNGRFLHQHSARLIQAAPCRPSNFSST